MGDTLTSDLKLARLLRDLNQVTRTSSLAPTTDEVSVDVPVDAPDAEGSEGVDHR
jgi:hypothetical protein